ncbi:hypothetical protein [Massilia glaciei]|uniref:DUF2156 domain-containing protein n=1 Tax=Massilia glaciei TaxID=1524097 RepID=A0A2U2HMI0_9BURK|nr:hypothetical protein [Massilia glaciei]PWF48710.1 hypothetical protein C7C56_010400 [Massilia glaciei]
MTLFNPRELIRLLKLGLTVAQLPLARLRFKKQINPDLINNTYSTFTKPHARFKFISNKTLGIALVDLSQFKTSDVYLDTVKQRDYGAFHRKRAKSRGYTIKKINRNDFIDEIHAINTSTAIRQGRPMDETYLIKKTDYPEQDGAVCIGALDREGRLVAYCNYLVLGNFASTDQLLGYKNGDGVMHYLLVEIICRLIDDGGLDYFMYDTYLGAQPGLQDFKRRIGFKPHRARYSMH